VLIGAALRRPQWRLAEQPLIAECQESGTAEDQTSDNRCPGDDCRARDEWLRQQQIWRSIWDFPPVSCLSVSLTRE
jgi:hypothetical protein